jgi:hypothetical protein
MIMYLTNIVKKKAKNDILNTPKKKNITAKKLLTQVKKRHGHKQNIYHIKWEEEALS